MKKKCLQCNTEYICRLARANESKFCSVRCRFDYEKVNGRIRLSEKERKEREVRRKIPIKTFICAGCDKVINRRTSSNKNKYCTRKCGMKHIGQMKTNPWNKGLDATDPKIAAAIQKQSATMKQLYDDGKLKTWNKGLTKDTDERVAKYVATQTKQRNTDGEWKDNWRKSLSKGQVHAHAAGKYPFTFTIPEQLTWAHLESLGHTVKAWADKSDDDPENTWYHQYNFEDAFVPDFSCPDLLHIIEVNGCYHHGHNGCGTYKQGSTDYVENNIKRDRRKYSMYHRHGWKWALVWECEAHAGDFHRIEEYLG